MMTSEFTFHHDVKVLHDQPRYRFEWVEIVWYLYGEFFSCHIIILSSIHSCPGCPSKISNSFGYSLVKNWITVPRSSPQAASPHGRHCSTLSLQIEAAVLLYSINHIRYQSSTSFRVQLSQTHRHVI